MVCWRRWGNKYGMRRFLDILNEAVIDDQKLLSDVYEIVYEYVTYGEWRTPNQFDEKLTRLMSLVPRPDHGELLYRVLRLTDEQRAEYEAGTLVMHNRRFSSWTNSHSSAIQLAQVRGDNTLIITHEFDPSHIVIDVREFYEEHDFTTFMGHEEYFNYVKIENEVIVHDSGEIKIDASNSHLFRAEPITPPQIGDKVFYHEDDHDGLEIEDVDYEQEWASRGLYTVTCSDGDEATVRNVGPGEWEIVSLGVS